MEGSRSASKALKSTCSLIWQGWFAGHFLLSLCFFYAPLKWAFSSKSRFPFALRLQRIWADYLRVVAGIPIRISGPMPPNATAVFVANHGNFLDIILAYRLVPGYFHFMAKASLAKVPLFKILFIHTHIPFNRHDPRQAMRAFLRAKQDLQAGISLFIFPEGTQNPNKGTLLTFKDGAFRLAMQTKSPIIPIVYHNNLELLPHQRKLFKRHTWGRPGIARIQFLSAVSTQDYHGTPEELALEVRRRMLECLEGRGMPLGR